MARCGLTPLMLAVEVNAPSYVAVHMPMHIPMHMSMHRHVHMSVHMSVHMHVHMPVIDACLRMPEGTHACDTCL